jgi:hypothetical protein
MSIDTHTTYNPLTHLYDGVDDCSTLCIMRANQFVAWQALV